MHLDNLRKRIPSKCIPLFLAPSWLDLPVIYILWRLNKTLVFNDKIMIITIISSGVFRYLIQFIFIGTVYFSGRDWLIKQFVYMGASLFCFLSYSREDFVWVLSLYLLTICILELIVSFYKKWRK